MHRQGGFLISNTVAGTRAAAQLAEHRLTCWVRPVPRALNNNFPKAGKVRCGRQAGLLSPRGCPCSWAAAPHGSDLPLCSGPFVLRQVPTCCRISALCRSCSAVQIPIRHDKAHRVLLTTGVSLNISQPYRHSH